MKIVSKQILEAINRGISIALDDYEEYDNNIVSPAKDIILKNDNLKYAVELDGLIESFEEGEEFTKDTLNRMAYLFKLTGDKYNVRSKFDLKDIIMYICQIDPKLNLNWIDISNIVDLSNLFEDLDFNGDISKWDVSNVLNMDNMFHNSTFNQDISNWDVSNVREHEDIFKDCPIKILFRPIFKR